MTKLTRQVIKRGVLTEFMVVLFGGAHGHLKSVTHLSMMKLGKVIPYPKKIQKIYESSDTPLEVC